MNLDIFGLWPSNDTAIRSCLDSNRQTVGEISKGSTSNVDANTVPLLFGAEDSLKCCFPSC